MSALYRMNESQLMNHIYGYPMRYGISDLEDYVDECDCVISRLESIAEDDEAPEDIIEADIEEVEALRSTAQEQLDRLYEEDERYMEREYWSMVI